MRLKVAVLIALLTVVCVFGGFLLLRAFLSASACTSIGCFDQVAILVIGAQSTALRGTVGNVSFDGCGEDLFIRVYSYNGDTSISLDKKYLPDTLDSVSVMVEQLDNCQEKRVIARVSQRVSLREDPQYINGGKHCGAACSIWRGSIMLSS